MEIKRTSEFKKEVKHIKDKKVKERIKKQIKKIIGNPETTGDSLRYKQGRKVKIPPFRIIYKYNKRKDVLKFIKFGHRDKIYKKK